MPIQAESRNPRLVSQLGAPRGSYNTKDPPELGSRGTPGSREALPSFSNFLERFYPEALFHYLNRRETLKRELSIFHAAHPRVMEMARREPNPVVQCRVMQADHDRLVAFYEGELSSLKRELYTRYERKYNDFRRNLLLLEVEREAKRTRSKASTRPSIESTILKPMRMPILLKGGKDSGESLSILISPTRTVPRERIRPEASLKAGPRVSNPEAQIPQERVQLSRSEVIPSSAEPDPVPAPQGLKTSPPSVACKPSPVCNSTTKGPRPLKSTYETGLVSISRSSPRPSVRVKPLEQLATAVLSREPPKGSSLMGITPSTRVVSVPSSKCGSARVPRKPPDRKVEVSLEKRTSAIRHSPVHKAAPTLLKSLPDSSIRVPTASSSKDKASLPSRANTTLRTSNIAKTRWVVSKMAHHNKIETPLRVSREFSSPRSDKTPSASGLEHVNARSKANAVPAGQASILYSSEVEERRPVPYAVVNRIMGKNEKTHSPLNNAVLSLRNPLPPVFQAPASCISLSKDGSAPSSLSSLSSREVAIQLASNVVSTRREASIITHSTPAKTCLRVPLSVSSPRFSKPPPAGVLECYKKCSNVSIGPAVKQALKVSSSKVEERRRVPTTVVSKRKGTNEETHAPVDNTTIRRPSPALVPSVQTLHACHSTDGVIPSSPAVAIPDTVHAVNNGRLASANAYREAETLVRVSIETAISRSGELPSTGVREHSYECSNLSKGLLCNEVLDKSTSNVTKEEQRVLEAIVNTRCKNGEPSSPASKAAPTLLKSAPVSSIRALPAGSSNPGRAPLADSSKDGILPSSRAILKSRASNVVGTHQVARAATHLNSEARTPSRVSRSLTLPPLDKSPHLAISVRHIPSVVSPKPTVSLNAHQKVETRSRVSLNASTPRLRKIPSADDIERSDEHSNVNIGPAVEQALASFSAEEGERRRVTDAIVSIHNGEKEEEYPPNPSIAFTLQAPTPNTPFVLPMNAASPHQPSDDSIPPFEVISGRHDIDVVNKTSEVYNLHSPSVETARKRSNHSNNPFSIEGEGQLARAAAYIQERSKCRSSAFDEFPRHSSKVPPDKPSEFASVGIASRRLEIDVDNRETKVSATRTSPVHHPESPKLSRPLSETTPELPTSAFVTPVVDSNEMKSRQFKVTVKTDRCSPSEQLETGNLVSKGPAIPTLTKASRLVCESLVSGRNVIQDGVVCFAVLQETSAADKAAGALQQPNEVVTPLQELNIVSNDDISVHSRLPTSLVTPVSPMGSSACCLQAPSPRRPGLVPSEMLPKSPEDGDFERRLHDVVSGGGIVSPNTCSPESTTESSTYTLSQSEIASYQRNRTVEVVPLQLETPRADLPSAKYLESTSMPARPSRNTCDDGVEERYPVRPTEAIKAVRCSFEHLETAEVSVEPVIPALIEVKWPLGSTKRQPTSLAVSKIETSARPHSPIPSTALTPFALSPAILSQADSLSESSMRLDQLVLKPPDDGGPKRYPYDAVNLIFTSSAIRKHSPEHKTGLLPVSKPVSPRDYSCSPLSVECWWWARGKPPNISVKKRRPNNVVNTKFSLSALKHLPSVEAALVLPILSAHLLRISSLCHPSIGLACPVRKPPIWIVCSQLLYEVVNTTSERKGIATNLSGPIDALNLDTPVISHPSRLRGCGLQMPNIASLSSSFARSCLWTA